MSLVLNEEQTLLKNSAEGLFAQKAPVSALRTLRDERDETGFSRELWQKMAAMGWASTFLPEQYGGLDCGLTEVAVVLQAGGRTLAASPLFSTVVLCASAILLAGNEQQKSSYLPPIAAGELLLALALEEGPRHSTNSIATSATARDGGFVLSGVKKHVLDGHVADHFVVVARTSGEQTAHEGISLFVIDSNLPGITVERRSMVDSRNMADVTFENVLVPGASLLGKVGAGHPVLTQVVDRGNIALCAEMLGSLQEVFERTLDYLKQREQFGELIGTFQALQHRASQMFCEIELAKSVVMGALQAVDSQAGNESLMASLTKVQVAETFRLVSDEAIQMHGGIGMTDEEEVGFYLKRARVAMQTLGDENYHVQRYAQLRGY